MAHAGQQISGPGIELRLIRTAAETDGELLELESTYGDDGVLPPAHFHPSQEERFEVLEGTVLTVIDGVSRRYETGDVFHVSAGVLHQLVGDGAARVNWQVRPALRTAEFFERLYTGIAAAERGEAFDIGELLAGHTDEIRFA
jgi:quercetin dioxygenase-like cupin family protein